MIELWIRIIISLIVLSIGVYTDVKYGKIKNIYTLILILSSCLLTLLFKNPNYMDLLYGMLIPFFAGIVLFAARMIGAGDVKLLCGLGAMFGVKWILWALAFSVLSGGLMSLCIIIKNKIFVERMKYLFNYFKYMLFNLKPSEYQNIEKKSKERFPFAIAIMCGSVLAMVGVFIFNIQ